MGRRERVVVVVVAVACCFGRILIFLTAVSLELLDSALWCWPRGHAATLLG